MINKCNDLKPWFWSRYLFSGGASPSPTGVMVKYIRYNNFFKPIPCFCFAEKKQLICGRVGVCSSRKCTTPLSRRVNG